MKCKHLLQLPLACLFLVPLLVQAGGGNISSSSASPNSCKAAPSCKVKFTVFGTGTCGIKVVWGDGQQTIYPIGLFNTGGGYGREFPHNYTKVGTYKPTATWSHIGETCTGSTWAGVKITGKLKRGFSSKYRLRGPCPAGWRTKHYEKSSGSYYCVPNRRIPRVKCPPKTKYYQTDCGFGCKPVPY